MNKVRYALLYSNDNRNFQTQLHGYGKLAKISALREAAKMSRQSGWAVDVHETTFGPAGLVLKDRVIKTYVYKRGS